VKTMMLQAASERGLLTPEGWEAALKDGSDLHQVRTSLAIAMVSSIKTWNTSSCGSDKQLYGYGS